jgi:hypothetical protein
MTDNYKAIRAFTKLIFNEDSDMAPNAPERKKKALEGGVFKDPVLDELLYDTLVLLETKKLVQGCVNPRVDYASDVHAFKRRWLGNPAPTEKAAKWKEIDKILTEFRSNLLDEVLK